jgi:hypothetical protein
MVAEGISDTGTAKAGGRPLNEEYKDIKFY